MLTFEPPPQMCVLQLSYLYPDPEQPDTPKVVLLRVMVLFPPPQGFVHSVHLDHSPHLQS